MSKSRPPAQPTPLSDALEGAQSQPCAPLRAGRGRDPGAARSGCPATTRRGHRRSIRSYCDGDIVGASRCEESLYDRLGVT